MLDDGAVLGHRVSGTGNLPHYNPPLPSLLLVFKTSLSWRIKFKAMSSIKHR